MTDRDLDLGLEQTDTGYTEQFTKAAKHFLENQAERARKHGDQSLYMKLLKARQNMR